MTIAETLRRAAVKMRAEAEAATPGPWYLPPGDAFQIWYGSSAAEVDRVDRGLSNGTVTEADAEEVYNQTGYLSYGAFVEKADAAYIASMHPVVAPAVALLLDNEANAMDSADEGRTQHGYNNARRSLLLSIATTYLGETP